MLVVPSDAEAGAASQVSQVVVVELLGGGGVGVVLPGISISPAKVGTDKMDTKSTATRNFWTIFIDLLLRFGSQKQ